MIREDLRLSIKLLSFYESINYYTICKELSDKYRKSDERLEKTDKNKVFEIFKSLGYEFVTYNSKERFYRIHEKSQQFEFYFHVDLRYGLAEIIFGVEKYYEKENVGGGIAGVCKLIEINKNQVTDGYFKDPAFGDYKDLENILDDYLKFYKDFKKEFIKQYS